MHAFLVCWTPFSRPMRPLARHDELASFTRSVPDPLNRWNFGNYSVDELFPLSSFQRSSQQQEDRRSTENEQNFAGLISKFTTTSSELSG